MIEGINEKEINDRNNEEILSFVDKYHEKKSKKDLLDNNLLTFIVYGIFLTLLYKKVLIGPFNNILIIGVIIFSAFISYLAYRYKSFDTIILNLIAILSMFFFLFKPIFTIYIIVLILLMVYVLVVLFKKNNNFGLSIAIGTFLILFFLSKLDLFISHFYSIHSIAEKTSQNNVDKIKLESNNIFFNVKNTIREAFLPIYDPTSYKDRIFGKELSSNNNIEFIPILKSFDGIYELDNIKSIPFTNYLTFTYSFDPKLKEYLISSNKNQISIEVSCELKESYYSIGLCALDNKEFKKEAIENLILDLRTINDNKKDLKIINHNLALLDKGKIVLNFDMNLYHTAEFYINYFSENYDLVQFKNLVNIGLKIIKFNKNEDSLIIKGYIGINDLSHRINDGTNTEIKNIKRLEFCFPKDIDIKVSDYFSEEWLNEDKKLEKCFIKEDLSFDIDSLFGNKKGGFIKIPFVLELNKELANKDLDIIGHINLDFTIKKQVNKDYSFNDKFKNLEYFALYTALISKKYDISNCNLIINDKGDKVEKIKNNDEKGLKKFCNTFKKFKSEVGKLDLEEYKINNKIFNPYYKGNWEEYYLFYSLIALKEKNGEFGNLFGIEEEFCKEFLKNSDLCENLDDYQSNFLATIKIFNNIYKKAKNSNRIYCNKYPDLVAFNSILANKYLCLDKKSKKLDDFLNERLNIIKNKEIIENLLNLLNEEISKNKDD